MSGKAFRPTIARMQNSMKILNSTKTNATIRDLEEEEGELEEKEGTVVSIKRDLINGAGWTVKDSEENTYICSCASSMYEVPETVERGGILYPTDTVEVVFTVNPVLRINTITEIKSLGEEEENLDISKWTHEDEATTVIAKPKSALSISNGFIKLDYNNDNKVLADKDAVKTQGKETTIDTQKLTINSPEVQLQGISIQDLISDSALSISNEYETYNVESLDDLSVHLDRTNNIAQLSIATYTHGLADYGVIGHIKNQKAIPLRIQSQQLVTDGHCVDNVVVDEDGVIYIQSFENECPEEKQISSTHNWITPQVQARNYIKVIVKQTCDYCDEANNTKGEYINYCPSCKNWNTLIDTPTSIKCTTCNSYYCQNCGSNINDSMAEPLKKYNNFYVVSHGTTCSHCKDELLPNTIKQYVNYCPDCKTWGFLYQDEKQEGSDIINILTCGSCNKQYCGTCGISQSSYGLTLGKHPVSYESYSNALRKLKYIRDGA